MWGMKSFPESRSWTTGATCYHNTEVTCLWDHLSLLPYHGQSSLWEAAWTTQQKNIQFTSSSIWPAWSTGAEEKDTEEVLLQWTQIHVLSVIQWGRHVFFFFWVPCVYFWFLLAIYFTHCSIYVNPNLPINDVIIENCTSICKLFLFSLPLFFHLFLLVGG